MKSKKSIYIVILIFVTLIGMWGIPALVYKMTYTPDQYPFVYFSSLLKKICLIDYKNKKYPMEDLDGNKYTTAQFDSLMPLLNFRQLMADGALPDSIDGHEIKPQILRAKSVVYRYDPTDMSLPAKGLYILFESMPKRGGLEIPDDVFRMKPTIEFVDAKTNRINEKKSDLFRKALEKEGFKYPAQWLSGNPNPRKPYDEGYFILDAEGQLFHLKMVNDRPYVRDTKIGKQMDVAYFAMLEVADKRFYGFLFNRQGELFIIENDGATYKTQKLGMDPVRMDRDEIILMGNLLYWTVSVVTPNEKKIYALESESLKQVASHSIPRTPGKWDVVSRWAFPVYLTFESKNSAYVRPYVHYTGMNGLTVNALLALLTGLFLPGGGRKKGWHAVYLLFTGLAGWVALLILTDFKNK